MTGSGGSLPPLTLDRRRDFPEGSYQPFVMDFGEFGYARYPTKILKGRNYAQDPTDRRIRRYRYAIGYTRSYTMEALGLQPLGPMLGREILWCHGYNPPTYTILKNPHKWAFTENHAAVLGTSQRYTLRFTAGIALTATPPPGQSRIRPIFSVSIQTHRQVHTGLVVDWLRYLVPQGRKVESVEHQGGRRIYLSPQYNTRSVDTARRPDAGNRTILITGADLI